MFNEFFIHCYIHLFDAVPIFSEQIWIKKGSVSKTRFCDLMSSHMMRRTAITTMLILGMPEHMVRNVSGHTDNSGSFYRYVQILKPCA
jgi:integrase